MVIEHYKKKGSGCVRYEVLEEKDLGANVMNRIKNEDVGEQCGNRRSLLGGENKEYSKVSWTHGGRMDEGNILSRRQKRMRNQNERFGISELQLQLLTVAANPMAVPVEEEGSAMIYPLCDCRGEGERLNNSESDE